MNSSATDGSDTTSITIGDRVSSAPCTTTAAIAGAPRMRQAARGPGDRGVHDMRATAELPPNDSPDRQVSAQPAVSTWRHAYG